MHADDTNYTVIKNGVAIRVEGNRLVIRDGPQETPPLLLTRAEVRRNLQHVIVCGHAGGFVTFDALRWLRDTGVAFSQLDAGGGPATRVWRDAGPCSCKSGLGDDRVKRQYSIVVE